MEETPHVIMPLFEGKEGCFEAGNRNFNKFLRNRCTNREAFEETEMVVLAENNARKTTDRYMDVKRATMHWNKTVGTTRDRQRIPRQTLLDYKTPRESRSKAGWSTERPS